MSGGTRAPAEFPEPHSAATRLSLPTEAVGDSVTVAGWTLVSRVTGFVRVAVTAAVLGPTFLGNAFQATNMLPNLIYYGLLAGSLVSSLLVPALVGHIDAGDRRSSERVAGSALGLALSGAVIVVPLALLAAPLLLELGTLGSPAAAVAAEQAHLARWFLLMLLPQVVLYAVVACSLAVMNAHRRFALGAAAPAVENLGCIAVLVTAGLIFPRTESLDLPTAELLLLGLGTTAAVALHAALQWWGARRSGVTLRPRRGWRDPEVRVLVRRSLPALAQAALDAVQLLCVLVVVNRIAGGVVGFQLALNFFFLPIALGATPVALSLSPRLSRLHQGHEPQLFRDTAVRGLRFGLFVSVPAAVALAVLAPVLASASSFGLMLTDGGALLVASGLVALAPGVVGETAFLVATYSCYARGDTRSPLRAMYVKAGICLTVLVGAAFSDGPAVVALAGIGVSAGAVVAAVCCVRALLRGLPRSGEALGVPALRTVVAAVVMAVPLGLAVHLMSGGLFAGPGGRFVALAGAVTACVVGGTSYVGLQWLLRAPEATWLLGALRGRRLDPLQVERAGS